MTDENAKGDVPDIDEPLTSMQSMNIRNDSPEDSCNEQDSTKKTDKLKIDILLKPTGNAPIMKKKKWTVDSDKKIGWIVEFIKKYLKLETNEKLFLYVNQTFAPSPDQIVKNLYDCYSTEGKLVLHYCKTQAWG
ncbi:autophagy protein 12-like [Anoplophora glabripennis]|uniref:autophagy protein 12-like n=1 Tax=Anoplophora glabripennis TaxID=217634 RepID=UPI000874F20F|nr:autophagy protein 12-like [Anoplophora glabripennis]